MTLHAPTRVRVYSTETLVPCLGVLCRVCGAIIRSTGRRGRPRVVCGDECLTASRRRHRTSYGTVDVGQLRTLRVAAGLSGAALARAARVRGGDLSRYERGINRPRTAVAKRLARALGVGVDDLA